MPPSRHEVAVFDTRPFFEKALVYGVQNGIIDQDRVAHILNDAPKGMLQIAEYFGTQYLRPNIEEARTRIVNLVSLFLLDRSGGDLDKGSTLAAGQHFSVAFAGRIGNAQSALGNARVRRHWQRGREVPKGVPG
jgi:hypothetical protein